MHGFEIKSQRSLSTSFVTLFTRAPSIPRAANNQLRLLYGSNDHEFPDVKVLHVSLFGHRWAAHSAGYSFKLEVDDNSQQLHLLIKETETDRLIENPIYWNYSILDTIVSKKIQRLAFVQAETVVRDNQELFHFERCSLYYGLTLDRLMQAIDAGDIMFDIRIGAYKNRNDKKFGKTHDHGSGFRIKKDKMGELYDFNLTL